MRTEELNDLLHQMSLEEKIGELVQLPAYFFDEQGGVTGPAAELGVTQEEINLAGSCLSVIGAEKLRALQEQHIRNHPHHIPMLFMADIINGYRTVFPIPLGQGSTFSPELAEQGAAVAAQEAAASGLHVTFSPMADLCRDPRWGRVMEGTGEDSWLNGEMAAAMVRGYQGQDNDLTRRGKLASCLKHFAGYGAPEAGRDYNTVELSERTLRDDYLPAYRRAVEQGTAMVMTSFNTLNRIPSTANRWLMRDVLRKEMGFDGVLISDWAAIQELMVHGIAADEAEAATLAMKAGVDIDMATTVYLKNLKALIESGKISEQLLDESVLRILALKNRLGLFENPFKDGSVEEEQRQLLSKEHREAARACAEESFVLLKNERNLLPLSVREQVAVIGPYADSKMLCGAWSIFAEDGDSVSIRTGIEERFPNCKVRFAPGCPMVDLGVRVNGFSKEVPKDSLNTAEAVEQAMQEAEALAAQVDKVVLTLGEPRDFTGESASRANLTLPQCQMELLRRVAAVNKNVIVVLFNGRPLDLREVSSLAGALLECWFPGTEGGPAVARTLYGASVPSGKLTMSMPYCVGQVPVYYNSMNTGRPLRGDYRTTRFCSQYSDIPNEPLYPFGFGLSYTKFTCSQVELSGDTLRKGDALEASVWVENVGRVSGKQTVQLYIWDLAGSVVRPLRELKGFEKILLAPGEGKKVTFQIREEQLRFFDCNMEYCSEPGRFQVFVGFDSTTDNSAEFTLLS